MIISVLTSRSALLVNLSFTLLLSLGILLSWRRPWCLGPNHYTPPASSLRLWRGEIVLSHIRYIPPQRPFPEDHIRQWWFVRWVSDTGLYSFDGGATRGHCVSTYLSLPVWPAYSIIAGHLLVIGVKRLLRRRKVGSTCTNCDYNLTGNSLHYIVSEKLSISA